MFGIGTGELILILVIVLVLFGGSKLPELSRSIGTAIKELREGIKEDTTEKPNPEDTSKQNDRA